MLVECDPVNRLTGCYRGVVLKHLPHGRCKVFIPGIYPDEWAQHPDMLPDAEQAAPLFAGSNDGNGVFSYPNISAAVWCLFANGDQNMPIIWAATLGGSNAFGQYEIVMPPRHEPGKQLSAIVSADIRSDRHLVTSGATQVEMFQSGVLSVQVSSPVRTAASVDFNNQYQLQRQDDHVLSRRECDMVSANRISNGDCKTVHDISAASGTILHQTNFFDLRTEENALARCRTFVSQDNAHNVDYGSANLSINTLDGRDEYNNTCENNDRRTQHILRHALSSQGRLAEQFSDSFTMDQDGVILNSVFSNAADGMSAVSTVKTAVRQGSGVYVESENLSSGYKCVINVNSETGMMELKVQDLSSDARSYIYLDRKGVITIDASEAIVLKAPAIKMKALDRDGNTGRIDTVAAYSTFKSLTQAEIQSKSIRINSAGGKTTIISNQEQTII